MINRLVYVIDDDYVDRMVATFLIEKTIASSICIGYQSVSQAIEDIQEKITRSPRDLPRLILLDINMPMQNGWDFLRLYEPLVKGLTVRLPYIYMLSSSFHPEDINRAKANPLVNGFITKPLTKTFIQGLLAKHSFN